MKNIQTCPICEADLYFHSQAHTDKVNMWVCENCEIEDWSKNDEFKIVIHKDTLKVLKIEYSKYISESNYINILFEFDIVIVTETINYNTLPYLSWDQEIYVNKDLKEQTDNAFNSLIESIIERFKKLSNFT